MSKIPDEFYNLIYLMEESGEVTQACSKIMRFGPDAMRKNTQTTNRELLEEELGDVLCLVDRLIDAGMISSKNVEKARKAKAKKLALWENSAKK